MFIDCAHLRIATAVLLASVSLAGTATAKPFEEYLKPTPIVSPLSSATWGVAGVLPRDISNGIESAKGAGVHPDYYYWDGQIIKAQDGKYHMFMSTFSGDTNFGTGWLNSDAYHAISQSNVLGPYQRQDYVYSNNGSHKGHNVSAVELPDGSYAVVVSEIVPLTIYKSSSLDGPWTGCSPTSQIGASNISLVPRHDNKFEIVERNGTIAVSDTLCGTYVKQHPTTGYTQNMTDSIYPKRTSTPGVSNPNYTYQEDPHIWRSGGVYHVIYSGSGDRVGWHVYSVDGLTNWKDNGYAWSPRDYQKIYCYEGTTTCTQWYKMERPGVVLEGGHPTHITWAVADVDKDNMVLPGTNHGTKIVVVPFDGVAFDSDFGVGGTGGAAGSGAVGSGGAGGRAGGGGAPGTGGAATGSGGQTGSGGRGGAGGRTQTGGSSGASGGVTGSGGAQPGSGGATASGGANGASGGTPGTGGTSHSGGNSGLPATGGTSGTGGSVGSGGAGDSHGSTGGSGTGTDGSTAGASDGASGCACSTASGPASRWDALVALAMGAAMWRGTRRRRRRG